MEQASSNNIKSYSGYLTIICLLSCLMVASPVKLLAQKFHSIHIEHSDRLLGARINGIDIKKLIGNVQLRHEGAIMHCDSAYLYQKENRFIAYSRVHIEQGDTLSLFADSLTYFGNGSYGTARNNIKLIDNQTTLYTNYLNFNFDTDIHRYLGGGKIIDSTNTLISQEGFLYGQSHEYRFLEEVELTTEDYYCTSDTLFYNTETHTARFFGPTEIFNDSSYLYSELGYYNTSLEFIKLGRMAYIEKQSQSLKADSIFYNKAAGFGSAFNHVWLEDSLQHLSVKSNYLYFNEKEEKSFATDSALMMMYETSDTLFLHADTLYMHTLEGKDKSRILRAWHHVKFFKSDLQGQCDSLAFHSLDSVITMYQEPVLWNEQNQLSADTIRIYLKDGTADRIELQQLSLIVSEQDSIHFNQIAGKNMIGFIKDKKLYRIDVDGNAQTIYYPVDEEGIVGINKAESSNLSIWIKDGKVSRLNFITKPAGKTLPLEKAGGDDSKLKSFKWLDAERPKNKYQLFFEKRTSL